MKSATFLSLTVLMLLTTAARPTVPVTLKGSPASMQRQNQVAKQSGYTFVHSSEEMRGLVDEGTLVPLQGNENYALLKGISSNVALPEMRMFIERLSEQYRAGTGEKLVVTSLTRPQSRQPRNSHQLSVHPTGLAVDLRVSRRRASRQWLESVLLKLERQGLLDVTRERWPPHYHVALFPEPYRAHVEGMIGPDALAEALAGIDPEEEDQADEKVEETNEKTGKVDKVTNKMVAHASTGSPAEDGGREPIRWPLLLAVPVVALAAVLIKRRRRNASGMNEGAA